MERKYDIICIGMAILDSIIRGFDPEPVSATGYRAESGSLNVGGDAVNEAIASARLGMKTGILCSLGMDPAGDMISSALKASGVSTDFIVRSEEHPTPVTTIFVLEDGNRRSITNGSHRYNFHPERFPESYTDTRAIILGSLFRAPFNDPEVIDSVLRTARSRGILVIADTKLPNFRRLSLDDLSGALPLIDYITPNEDEARFYTGREDPEEMADVFIEKGANNVIIKLGGRGCCLRSKDGFTYIPAMKTDVIDATGAGDNFIAGFTSELIRGSSPEEALRFANACGAVCCTAVGAGNALRSREQILEFLRSRDE